MTSPQTPYGYAAAPAYRAPDRAGLAITAFSLALTAAAISQIMYIAQFVLISRGPSAYQLWALIVGFTSAGTAILAIAALVLGLIAMRGSRRLLSGIAIGVSALHITTAVIGLIGPLLVSLAGG